MMFRASVYMMLLMCCNAQAMLENGGACGMLPSNSERLAQATLLGGEFRAAGLRRHEGNPYLRVAVKERISPDRAAEDAERVCCLLQIVRCSRFVPYKEDFVPDDDICCQADCCYGRSHKQLGVGCCRGMCCILACPCAFMILYSCIR